MGDPRRSSAATQDVLSELEAIVARLSARLSDSEVEQTDEEAAAQLIREAAREYAKEHRQDAKAVTPAAPVLSEEALLALTRVLTGPKAKVYRAASRSDPDKSHTLTVDGGEVTCTCPGFEYRGACRHSRELKAAPASKSSLSAGLTVGS